MPVAVSLGRVHELFELSLRQVFPGANVAVGRAPGCNCSFYGAGVTSFRCAFVMVSALPAKTTVRTMLVVRPVTKEKRTALVSHFDSLTAAPAPRCQRRANVLAKA